jgi:transcription elongation factor GreB
MSRAFVKETDGEFEDEGLPAAPTGPLRVSAGTLEAWRAQLAEAEATAHRLRESEAPEERLELANARRHAALLGARIDAAVVVEDEGRAPGEAGFGSAVELEDGTGRRWRFTLVGGEEADPSTGRISWRSPLGKELMGRRKGDAVAWARHDGTLELTVLAVEDPG